jgi:hypothetical protein
MGELLVMARLASGITLILVLLLPCLAWAGWGDERWGEMVWGRSVIPVPSLSIEGLIALVSMLALASAVLLVRRRRGTRP